MGMPPCCSLCGNGIRDLYEDFVHEQSTGCVSEFHLRPGDGQWHKWGRALYSNYISSIGKGDGLGHKGHVISVAVKLTVEPTPSEETAEDSDEDAIGEHVLISSGPQNAYAVEWVRDSVFWEYAVLNYSTGAAIPVHAGCLNLALAWMKTDVNEFFSSPTGSTLECTCLETRSFQSSGDLEFNRVSSGEDHNDHNYSVHEDIKGPWGIDRLFDDEMNKLHVQYIDYDLPDYVQEGEYSEEERAPVYQWRFMRPDRFPPLPALQYGNTAATTDSQPEWPSDPLARLPMDVLLLILEHLDEASFLRLQATSRSWRWFFLEASYPQVQSLYRGRCVALGWVPTSADTKRSAKAFQSVLDSCATIDWRSYYMSCTRSGSMRNRNRIYRVVKHIYAYIHGGEGREEVIQYYWRRFKAKNGWLPDNVELTESGSVRFV
ncbi:hypothetical protein BC832DRAFT_591861 [Gaertneriomyces semiglobifer]|nr:hypothetical protein BC832DRAFT_591861 [Gaertneriomyces semiglobifer]